MTNPYRALCAELVDIITAHANPDDAAVGYVAGILTRARALLAEVDGPAVPESREPASVVGEPSDEELLELMPETMRDDISYAAELLGVTCDETDKTCAVLEYARAVWAQACAIQRDRNARPAPPAEGEVAELVEFLTPNREQAGAISFEAFVKLRRAAELLQQQEAELQECRKVAAAFENFNQQRNAND